MLKKIHKKSFSFIDLFAGIGGFHIALHDLGGRCVFVNEFDKHAKRTYKNYFQNIEKNLFADEEKESYFWNDIREITGSLVNKSERSRLKNIKKVIPDFDILCGGFPCQPFSQAGHKRGFDDARGTMFLEIDRILEAKKPSAVFLENVRNLVSHDDGYTLGRILQHLEERGYDIITPDIGAANLGDKNIAKEYVRVNKGKTWNILRASDFGVSTYRPRVYIVAFNKKKVIKKRRVSFSFPTPYEKKVTLKSVLGRPWPDIIGRTLRVGGRGSPHGNRHNWDSYSGTDSSRLIIGPHEGLKIMGFPRDFKFPADLSNAQQMKQLGNSVAVPVIRIVGAKIIETLYD